MRNNNNYNNGQFVPYYGGGISFSNGRGQYAQNAEPKKRTGCKVSSKNGKQYMTGWRLTSKFGMLTYWAFMYKGSHEVVSKNNNRFVTCLVQMTIKATGVTVLKPALWNMSKGTVICQDFNIVMNPKARRGGYCGTFINK